MRQRKQTYFIIHWFNIDKVVKILEIGKLFNFQMKFCQKVQFVLRVEKLFRRIKKFRSLQNQTFVVIPQM